MYLLPCGAQKVARNEYVAGGGHIHACLVGERVRSILRYDFNGRSLTYDGPKALVEYDETAILEGVLGHAEELESLAGQLMEGLDL